ncbi:MAG: hypothetical protein JXA33_09565 [Anaerolineae bacterium]|nr:hypothetical protein [Anaerolineae bacterium]
MPVARDIALIFLSLEAFVVALVPLAIFAGLAYGVYWLKLRIRTGLQIAQGYAQEVYEYVERASKAVAEPFIRVHETTQMVTTMVNKLVSRRKA